MPGFTMCIDDDCPYKKKCKRHPDSGTIATMYWQSWGFFVKSGPPTKPENCEGWMPQDGE